MVDNIGFICVMIGLAPFYISCLILFIKDIIDCWFRHILTEEAFWHECFIFSCILCIISLVGGVVGLFVDIIIKIFN